MSGQAQKSGGKFDLKLTRRNLMSIGTILAGTLLEGCKFETVINNYYTYNAPSNTPSCYLAGTRVLTKNGEEKIEELRVGDHLVVSEGRTRPILGIGRRRYTRDSHENWPQEIRPVRISRGALLPNAPRADLYVSQNHRMYLHGMLIRAADLLTEASIAIDPYNESEVLEYFHPYVGEEHEIMSAEGTLGETLLLDRLILQAFDNSEQLLKLLSKNCDVPKPYAPVFDYQSRGKRAMVWSHFRSALSPWIDVRNQTDRVRDLLAERGAVS